jgi:hypothetical protein
VTGIAPALRERTRRTVACALLAGASVSCQGAAGPAASAGDAGSQPSRVELSASSRAWTREVDSGVTAPETKKFVRIEVAEVVNPQRIPISFHVFYAAPREERVLLGVFSLFPPDRPGTFIVPSQGRLRSGGTVTVELVPATGREELHNVRVRLGRVAFVDK